MPTQAPYIIAEKQGSNDGITWLPISSQYSDNSCVIHSENVNFYKSYRMVFSNKDGQTIILALTI